jgi:acyl dehydratase
MSPRASPRVSSKAVGFEVGPLSAQVDARWLMAYAAALGETDPRYYDTAAPTGPAAHPLFPVCWEWPAALALRAKALKEELAPRGVHAAHHLVIHRAPVAGDRMVTRARVVLVRPTRAGALVVMRFATVDRNGRPVATTEYTSIFRGVEADGEASVAVDSLPRPAPPAEDRTRWTAEVVVPVWAAHVYTEGARIWNPIHTDAAVARAAGLPAPILHGTATLALALSQVLARDLGGDAARVRVVAARFTGMVVPPARLAVRGRGRDEGAIGFDALDERGAVVLAEGVVGL